MTRRFLFAAVYVLIFLSLIPVSYAQYLWTDEKGTIHITDYPKPGPRRPVEREQPDASLSTPVSKKIVSPASPVVVQTADQVIKQESAQPSMQAAQGGQDAKTAKPGGAASVASKAVPPSSTPVAVQQPKQVPVSMPSKTVPPSPAPMPSQQPKQATASPAQTAQQSPGAPAIRETGPSAVQPAATPDMVPPAVAAMVAGFMSVLLFVFAAAYLFFSLCLFLIARKLEVSAAWTAWIPVIQVVAFLGSARKPLWWFLLFFIPFVGLFVGIYLWMCIAENLGKNKMLGILTIVPIVNFIILAVLAFSKKEGSLAASPA